MVNIMGGYMGFILEGGSCVRPPVVASLLQVSLIILLECRNGLSDIYTDFLPYCRSRCPLFHFTTGYDRCIGPQHSQPACCIFTNFIPRQMTVSILCWNDTLEHRNVTWLKTSSLSACGGTILVYLVCWATWPYRIQFKVEQVQTLCRRVLPHLLFSDFIHYAPSLLWPRLNLKT